MFKNSFSGTVEDITFSNITINNVIDDAISITMNYSGFFNINKPPTNSTATPIFKNIRIENFTVLNPEYGWYINGLPENPMENVSFSNINISNARTVIDRCSNIKGSCNNVMPYCPPCMQIESNAAMGFISISIYYKWQLFIFVLCCFLFNF